MNEFLEQYAEVAYIIAFLAVLAGISATAVGAFRMVIGEQLYADLTRETK